MGESIKISFAYNEIQDIGDAFVLWKNPQLDPAGSFFFKNVLVEFGFDPTVNKVKIKRMGYSKRNYTKAEVEDIAFKTKNCKFCKVGKPLEMLNINTNGIINYINTNYSKKEDMNMVTMTDFLDTITKMPELNKTLLPQVFSRLINLVGSLVIPNEFIRRIGFNLAGGLIGLIVNEYFMDTGRLKDELRIFFGNWLTNAIPNIDIPKIISDFQELTRAARFGGPLDVLKTMFQSPIEQLQAGIREVTRAIGFGGQLPIGFQQQRQLPIGFQAPGQVRGIRRPEFPIPFGEQVATTGFQLPPVSPLGRPGVVTPIARGSQWQTEGPRMGGFRVTQGRFL